MANPKRAMARMVRIDDVMPIDGADRIEAAMVGGWTVVIGKGEYQQGDPAVYFEIDTLLPQGDERYAFIQDDHPKEMVVDGVVKRGHVLRTRRMRGVYSQGLLMKPEAVLPSSIPSYAYWDMCDRKANVTSLCGVCEYVPMQPLNAGFLGKYDPYIGPRTDAERAQNVDKDTWNLIKRSRYEVSVKVDGMSVSMLYDDRVNRFRMYSHNNELDLDSPGIPKIAYETAKAQGLVGFCEANHMVTLQAELCGPKIQGDRLGLGKHRLFVFSIWDIRNAEYVSFCSFDGYDHGDKVQGSYVPVIDTGVLLDQFATPSDFLEHVDGIKGNVTNGRLDEGLVVHVYDSGTLSNEEWLKLQNALGPTCQCKAISNRYLLKAKE